MRKFFKWNYAQSFIFLSRKIAWATKKKLVGGFICDISEECYNRHYATALASYPLFTRFVLFRASFPFYSFKVIHFRADRLENVISEVKLIKKHNFYASFAIISVAGTLRYTNIPYTFFFLLSPSFLCSTFASSIDWLDVKTHETMTKRATHTELSCLGFILAHVRRLRRVHC